MKKNILTALLVIALLSLAVYVYAGGTVVQTNKLLKVIKRIEIGWTASAGGGADATITNVPAGRIMRIVFESDTGATNPSNNYDVTLKDQEEVDVLMGQGANISTSAVQVICPAMRITGNTANATSAIPVVVLDSLDLVVTNAGASKAGDITILISPQ